MLCVLGVIKARQRAPIMTQGLRRRPHQIRGGKCGYGERRGEKVLVDNRSLQMRFLLSFLPRLLAAGYLGGVTANGVDSG